jgi:hypothetical protein
VIYNKKEQRAIERAWEAERASRMRDLAAHAVARAVRDYLRARDTDACQNLLPYIQAMREALAQYDTQREEP